MTSALSHALYFLLLTSGFYLSRVRSEEMSTTTKPPPATSPAPSTDPPSKHLKDNKLVAVTLLDPPFVMTTSRGHEYRGFAIDILNEATKAIGYAEVEVRISDDPQWGWEESPGVWTGMIGQVENKSADVAVGAFAISSKRSEVVEYSQPFMHAGFRVLYKIPDAWNPHQAMVTLLKPFSAGLWVLIILMFVFASLGLYIIGRFSPYEDIAFVGKTATYEGLNLPNSFLYIFSTLVWQGYTAAPKSTSGRILTFVWWVFAVLTIGAYIAGLCVILFKVEPEIRTLPFTTIDEMSRQTKVGLMVVKGSTTFNYLNRTSNKAEKKIFARIMIQDDELLVKSIAEGLDKMMKSDGKFALIMDGAAAKYLSSQEPCNKMVIGEAMGDHSFGFVCGHGTGVCKNITTQILAMREDGRMSKLEEKWFSAGCLKDSKAYVFEGLPFFDTFGGEPDAIMPRVITIKRFSAAFILLVIGIVLAGIALGVEIYFAKRRGTAVPRKLETDRPDDDTGRLDSAFRDDMS